jgi:hypothetical protein
LGCILLAGAVGSALSLLTWNAADPSLTHAASGPIRNGLGAVGAIASDLIMQLVGLAGVFMVLPLVFWALQLIGEGRLDKARIKLMLAPVAMLLLACAASSLPRIDGWPLEHTVGGLLGDVLLSAVTSVLAMIRPERASAAAGLFCFAGGMLMLMASLGLSQRDLKLIFARPRELDFRLVVSAWRKLGEMSERAVLVRREPTLRMPESPPAGSPFAPMAHEDFGFGGTARSGSASSHGYYPDAALPAPTSDDDIDTRELERIASICAPERAGKAADREVPQAVLRSEPAADIDLGGRLQAPLGPDRRAAHGIERRLPVPSVVPRQPLPPPAAGWRPQSAPGGDDLYGRAVMIVLDDRKPSVAYLQHRLKIGYMRAADLIERMEREGILGAPVYNGLRPILMDGQGSREV